MATDHAHRTGRGRTIFALKLAVSVVLLSWLLASVDRGVLWAAARRAAPAWIAVALGVFFLNVAASAWRWRLLLEAQGIHVTGRSLLASYLVAGFFNNFLPSNIGGDVVRVRDTAAAAGSKTRATTVILMDRGLGLLGLVFVAALGATVGARMGTDPPLIGPAWLWAAFAAGVAFTVPAVAAPGAINRLLQPLTVIHREWIGQRIDTLTGALAQFRQRPGALAACFAGAIVVQLLLVAYYLTVAFAIAVPIRFWDLAVLVPVSFVIQMLPVSVNGFGVREATFTIYFNHLGLPRELAVLLSLMATFLMMVFSLSGAAVYVSRSDRRARDAANEAVAYPD
jgi:hypothetical protein